MHGDVEPSSDNLLSGRVSGRAPKPSRSRVDDDSDDETFRGFQIRFLGFSVEEVFMGERATSGEPYGPHTMCWRTGGTRTAMWCGGLVAPSFSSSDFVYVTVK